MRDRTAQNCRMKLTGAVKIGDVLAAPAQKPHVFDAFDVAADIGVLHGGDDLEGYPPPTKALALLALSRPLPPSFDKLRIGGRGELRCI